MNSKIFIWFRTEYKRAAAMLPLILKRAVILVMVCAIMAGITVFFVNEIKQKEPQKDISVNIGYVAGTDNMTQLAIKYVKGIASVKAMCNLQSYDLEEGMDRLRAKDIDALVVLPDNIIEGILTGSNAPATIYVSDDGMKMASEFNGLGNIGGLIFRELVSSGVSMLKTAQAQIYVASDMAHKNIADNYDIILQADKLQSAFDEINRYNLSMAITRESLFKTKQLSVTGNDSPVVYYGGALITVYLMFSGLFLGVYCKRSCIMQKMFNKRLGIPYILQIVSQMAVMVKLLAVVGALPLLLLVYRPFREYVNIEISVCDIFLVILVLIMMSAYFLLIYQAVEKKELALLVVGLSAFVQGYMSGCFVPEVLLPDKIALVGKYLPAWYMRTVFAGLFGGKSKNNTMIITGIIVWTVVFCFVIWLLMNKNISEEHTITAKRYEIKNNSTNVKKIKIQGGLNSLKNSLFGVLFRRLIYHRSIWITLVFMIIISIGIVNAEKSSDTVIHIGVYDEADIFIEELQAHSGLICFDKYASVEELKKAVLTDKVESGYVIPKEVKGKSFIQAMMDNDAKKAITIYEDADTITTDIVNEIVFETIFRESSLRCFEQYIASSEYFETCKNDIDIYAAVKEMIQDKLDENVTFDVQIRDVSGSQAKNPQEIFKSYSTDKEETDEDETTYPVAGVILVAVFLCVVQSLIYIMNDFRQNLFYKRNRPVVAIITMLQSAGLCFVAGAALMLFFLLT